MKFKKDFIIVHFQEGFFDTTNQRIRNTVKNTLEPLIANAQTTDIHVSFWEDDKVKDTTSVIPIPPLSERVSRFVARKGLIEDEYPLKGKEIILVGGWFGACINGAIESVMTEFFRSPLLLETSELTIRMPETGVYKETELLSELDDANIISGIVSAFDNSAAVTEPIVTNRGLRFKIIRTKTQETLTEQMVVPVPNNPKERMFDVVFLID
ncbi:hypothetical protein [uncultured Kordia sp.]|uniref:hypothetical protein n=1 Tax=uncultured Kordia sp. TaxID=507699 RepID=UPI00261EC1BB|nr:hypothetical protein [uncultured Kordia sp.]